jgi:hypothetical protein
MAFQMAEIVSSVDLHTISVHELNQGLPTTVSVCQEVLISKMQIHLFTDPY